MSELVLEPWSLKCGEAQGWGRVGIKLAQVEGTPREAPDVGRLLILKSPCPAFAEDGLCQPALAPGPQPPASGRAANAGL